MFTGRACHSHRAHPTQQPIKKQSQRASITGCWWTEFYVSFLLSQGFTRSTFLSTSPPQAKQGEKNITHTCVECGLFFFFFYVGLVPSSYVMAIYLKYYNLFAAKSLQSCLTLCDPIDGSPPGSPVPGILQARTLEWVAISFSNA